MLFILIPIHTKGFLDFEPLWTRLASRFANCSLMTLKIIHLNSTWILKNRIFLMLISNSLKSCKKVNIIKVHTKGLGSLTFFKSLFAPFL
jgi:hypothetical protein